MFDSQFTENLLEKIGGNSVTLVLDKSGTCVFVSSNVEAVLGYERERLLNQPLVQQLPLFSLEGRQIEEQKNPIAKALGSRNFVQSTPFFCRLTADGTDTFALTTIVIAGSELHEAAPQVVVQIRKTKREVDVGEMKSLFVSFAAHQLKTPSSVVKGFLELMMREGEASYSKEQWHFLTSAFEANEQLISVSKSLLNMARLEGGLIEPKLADFDPNRALQTKIASFAPLYKTKRVTIGLSASADDSLDAASSQVKSDESFFLEVFGILLGNAIKHSPIGENIKVSSVLGANYCEVHVIDNGPGIPAAVAETLFTAEQESSEQENSHGLGLYMAKKYIALLGGSIGLAASRQGSDFYFRIPNRNN